MKTLIVTKQNDNECIDMVTRALAKRGATAFRLDTDLFPTQIDIRVRVANGERRTELARGSERVEVGELVGAWHRRLAIAEQLPKNMDPQVRFASVEESRRVLHGVLASLPCFTIDPWPVIRIAENKQLQLEIARSCGLDVPRTLITNDPTAARAFFDECRGAVVTKMMASFAIYEEGREKVVFTTPVKERDLAAMDGLRLCPMTFQEQLEKQSELRVTVVGERVFTASVDSNQMERSKTDWRREGVALLGRWQAAQLPQDVERGLLRLMDALGLNYGAIDVIVTPEGRYVFLEVNPVGEFFWLERENGMPVSEAIADVMLDLAPRREVKLLREDPRGAPR